jgi:hypothetical protein
MVLDADEREPALVRGPDEVAAAIQRVRVRDDRDPNL